MGTILEHQLKINADSYTPVDESLITTGEIVSVENTVMDFRIFKAIRKDINNNEEQLKYGLGYDHNWVLAATLYEKNSDRFMEVLTIEPGPV